MRGAERIGRELLAEADIVVNGDRSWDIQVHDERMWDRVVRDRELGLGESYQEGWWDAAAVDEFLVRIITADLKSKVRPSLDLLVLAAKALIVNSQTVRRAHQNASAHYDIGNDLYERMLDKRMIYSCAYWSQADDLDSAQEAKLDLICRKLDLEPGMSVLDIGCGWGGFVQFAAERYGAQVTGISPAIEQVRVARQRTAGLDVDIRQLDYRDMTGTFDRIVSVGMLEHVGPANYETFFAKADELLTPDGVMLHHTIGGQQTKKVGDPWFNKYIFPGGVVPSLPQLALASEGAWAIEDLHNFGPDYDRTLMAWYRRIEDAWDLLPDYDEHFRRTWRYYLMASAAGFRTRGLQLWQLAMRRTSRVSPTFVTVR